MKTLIYSFLCLVAMQSATAQSPVIDAFYQEHRRDDQSLHFTLGNAAIKMGSWFIEEPATRKLVRKSNRARVLVSDQGEKVSETALNRFFRDLEREHFEPLIQLRDGADNIVVYMYEDRSKIRNLVACYRNQSEFVMVSMDCNLQLEDIQAVIDQEL